MLHEGGLIGPGRCPRHPHLPQTLGAAECFCRAPLVISEEHAGTAVDVETGEVLDLGPEPPIPSGAPHRQDSQSPGHHGLEPVNAKAGDCWCGAPQGELVTRWARRDVATTIFCH